MLEELEKVRSQLSIKKQQCLVLSRKLSDLKSGNMSDNYRIVRCEAEKLTLKQQNSVLEGINRIFRETLSCHTEEDLGKMCLKVVEEVTLSQFGVIAELSKEGRLYDIAISNPGWKACRMANPVGHRIFPGGFDPKGIYGKVLRDGKGFYTNTPYVHPDSVGIPNGHPPLRAFLGVPLIHAERTIGMIGVANRAGGYRDTDLRAIKMMAPAIVQALLSKKAEKILRREAQILEQVHDAVITTDLDGKITLWNNGARRLFGYTAEEALGRPVSFIYFQEDFSVLNDKIMASVLDKGERELEIRARAKSGQIVFIHLSLSLLRNEDGSPYGLIGYSLDITARKQTEEELARQKELLQQIFDNIPILLVMWDAQIGGFVINRYTEAVLGWTTEDANKGNFMSKVYPESTYRAKVAASMQSHEAGWREWKSITKDGRSVPIEWANIRLSNDTILRIGVDLTERKEAERALRQLNETLEQRVTERTAIAETRASQLQRLALELSNTEDRERRQIAMILHDDLQQYLAAIRFHLQMLESKDPKIDTMKDRVKQLIRLIDESIQKCRSLSHELSPPVLHRNGLLAALQWLAQDIEAKHGLKVRLETDDEVKPASRALGSLLYRSVRELLFNVVKHSTADVAVIEVRKKTGWIKICVKDRGKGCDPSKIRQKDGNMEGFGLFNIEERINFMGGKFEIHSASGKGCTVILTVPNEGRPVEEEKSLHSEVVKHKISDISAGN